MRGQEHHCRHFAGHVSASLAPLRNNYVRPGLLCTNRRFDRANLMYNRDAGRMGGGYEFSRISPKERQGRYAFLDANLNPLVMREVEYEIDAKRPRS